MRLVVLEMDEPMPSLREKLGSYEQYFKTLFESAKMLLEPPQVQLDITSYRTFDPQGDVTALPTLEQLKEESVDAIVLSGSKFNAHDNDKWILDTITFIQAVWQSMPHVKFLGICFGHQLLARALGGQTGPSSKGWEVSKTTVSICLQFLPRPMRLLWEKHLKHDKDCGSVRLFQMHRDAVSKPVEGSQVFGQNEQCAIQGMIVFGRLLSIQGHPEFNTLTVQEVLKARMASGALSQEEGEDGMARSLGADDGVVVAAGMLEFLRYH